MSTRGHGNKVLEMLSRKILCRFFLSLSPSFFFRSLTLFRLNLINVTSFLFRLVVLLRSFEFGTKQPNQIERKKTTNATQKTSKKERKNLKKHSKSVVSENFNWSKLGFFFDELLIALMLCVCVDFLVRFGVWLPLLLLLIFVFRLFFQHCSHYAQ